VKRVFDVVLSSLALLSVLPFMGLIAILLRASMGSPIFFKQLRPGKDGKPFVLLKFRTMLNATDSNISDSSRMTCFGSFLRKFSVDELPQLWNVLRGDMSLVGPRPLLMEYLNLYTSEQNRRHEVRPGITGWAQVNGRNVLSWDEKFALDVWYVDNRSFWLDLKILFLTIRKVVAREGISQAGEVTMAKFKGTQT
jgi:lipopolysaccharide/colanic/teichoic acid biosynthesis glycosyltransferase